MLSSGLSWDAIGVFACVALTAAAAICSSLLAVWTKLSSIDATLRSVATQVTHEAATNREDHGRIWDRLDQHGEAIASCTTPGRPHA